ncbi:MAG TPA: hypothetical protein HA348_07370 [Thermoplasmata archaeon]|nr:hypothetical protein [Thermoplasmata archaeon]
MKRERRENFSSQPSKNYEPVKVTRSDSSHSLVSEPDSYLISARNEFIAQLYQTNRFSPYRDDVLSNLLEYYLGWRNTKTYLVFKEQIGAPESSVTENYQAVLASKRGNEVYRWRLKNRIKDLKNLFPSVDITNSAHSFSGTKILFITLTCSERKKYQ